MLSQRKYFGMSQQEKSTLLHGMVSVVCFLSVIVVPLCFFLLCTLGLLLVSIPLLCC